MTATVAVVAVAMWLVLQIPIGMAIGCYIRRARTPAQAQPRLSRRERRRSKRRPFVRGPLLAVLLRA